MLKKKKEEEEEEEERRSLACNDSDVMETGKAAAFHRGPGDHNFSVPCWSAVGLRGLEQAGLPRMWSSRENVLPKRAGCSWDGRAARIFQKACGHFPRVQNKLFYTMLSDVKKMPPLWEG